MWEYPRYTPPLEGVGDCLAVFALPTVAQVAGIAIPVPRNSRGASTDRYLQLARRLPFHVAWQTERASKHLKNEHADLRSAS